MGCTISCTVEQWRRLELAVRNHPPQEGMVVRRRWESPQWHTPCPGVRLRECSERLLSSMSKLYAARRQDAMAELCRPPTYMGRSLGPNPPNVQQVDTTIEHLAELIAGLEPFDVVELLPGKYSANLVVTAKDVVLKGSASTSQQGFREGTGFC